MVMDAAPSPQSVGREFVRQYYTLLNKAPHHLHRFYNHQSSFIHGGLEHSSDQSEPTATRDTPANSIPPVVVGQVQIHNKIQQLGFRDCHAKISQVDAQTTLGSGIVVQATGELSNDGQPMRRFTQTFVLAFQAPKKYYVHNDIFRYQDVWQEDDQDSGCAGQQQIDESSDRSEVTDADGQEGGGMGGTSNGDMTGSINVPSSTNSPPVLDHQQQQQQPQSMPIQVQQQQPIYNNVVVQQQQPPVNINNKPGVPVMAGPGAGFVTQNGPMNPASAQHVSSQQQPQPTMQSSHIPNNQQQQQQAPIIEHVMTMDSSMQTTVAPAVIAQAAAPLPLLPEEQVKPLVVEKQQQPEEETKPVVVTQPELKTYANLVKSGGSVGSMTFTRSANLVPQHQSQNVSPPPSAHHQQAKYQENSGGSSMMSSGLQQRPQQQRQGGDNNLRQHQIRERRSSTNNSNYSSDNTQLFVGNIPHHATDDDLKAIFSKYGQVVDLRIFTKQGLMGGQPGKMGGGGMTGGRVPQNYGFITFKEPESVQAVLANPNICFPEDAPDGQKLNIEEKINRVRMGNDSGDRGGGDRRPMGGSHQMGNGSGLGGDRRPAGGGMGGRGGAPTGGMMRGAGGGGPRGGNGSSGPNNGGPRGGGGGSFNRGQLIRSNGGSGGNGNGGAGLSNNNNTYVRR